MKFEITVPKGDENVKIKNLSDEVYLYPHSGIKLEIKPNCDVILNKYLAKTLFGDWEKEGEFAEQLRRKQKGIEHYEIITKHIEIPVSLKKVEEEVEVSISEPEFVDLWDEPEINVQTTELKTCQGVTKAGKPCKRLAVTGGKYCTQHI